MKNTYFDLIEQTYYFPQDGFDLQDGYLTFHGVSIKYLIEKYGTPLRLMYLPRIGEQIKRARNLFNRAIKANNYNGSYEYCYCTKCCHFYHVVSEALKYNVQLETSSSFDIDLIRCLYNNGQIDKKIKIIHNGFKTDEYIEKIVELQKDGFENSIIVPTLCRQCAPTPTSVCIRKTTFTRYSPWRCLCAVGLRFRRWRVFRLPS